MGKAECNCIGSRIGSLMREQGMNQKELAAAVGVTEATMSRYLNGDREPKIMVVAKLAWALHTTTDFLIYGDVQESEYDEIYKAVYRASKTLDDKQRLELVRLLV